MINLIRLIESRARGSGREGESASIHRWNPQVRARAIRGNILRLCWMRGWARCATATPRSSSLAPADAALEQARNTAQAQIAHTGARVCTTKPRAPFRHGRDILGAEANGNQRGVLRVRVVISPRFGHQHHQLTFSRLCDLGWSASCRSWTAKLSRSLGAPQVRCSAVTRYFFSFWS